MSHNHPQLTKRNKNKALKILFDITEFLEKNNIPYHLEGGTLLGIVRDNDLLPWDHDVDLSISVEDLLKYLIICFLKVIE
jgi:phosphorylcholine metabolism protein LicD